MPAEQRAIYEATPAWLYVFYGLATFGGVAGSIGLLLRRRWAVPVYLLALVALVLQVVASYAVTPAWSVSGAAGLRSEEHTSELQSLMRSSYAVFCLQKKKRDTAQRYD